jgi:hypothetical protein
MDSAKKRSISLGKPYGLTENDFGVVPNEQPTTPKNIIKFNSKGERVK